MIIYLSPGHIALTFSCLSLFRFHLFYYSQLDSNVAPVGYYLSFIEREHWRPHDLECSAETCWTIYVYSSDGGG